MNADAARAAQAIGLHAGIMVYIHHDVTAVAYPVNFTNVYIRQTEASRHDHVQRND